MSKSCVLGTVGIETARASLIRQVFTFISLFYNKNHTISVIWLTYSILSIVLDICLSLGDCVVHLSMVMFS